MQDIETLDIYGYRDDKSEWPKSAECQGSARKALKVYIGKLKA
jgi:hypothetical protein